MCFARLKGMKVTNCHKRIINQPKEKVSLLFDTLATSEDLIWPVQNWPAMRLKQGLKSGSQGGHGQIRYTVIEFKPRTSIKFEFTKPIEFKGTHELILLELSENVSELRHTIKMNTTFIASLLWLFVIRWLHDALIEEAFDNVENYFQNEEKNIRYTLWVKILRAFYKQKSLQLKHV